MSPVLRATVLGFVPALVVVAHGALGSGAVDVTTAALAGTAFVLTAGIAFALRDRGDPRVAAVREQLQLLSDGGDARHLPEEGEGEAADLARAFNAMVANRSAVEDVMHNQLATHREVAAAARRSQSMRAAMLASTPDGFITIDGDGIVVEANAVIEEMFGWTSDELVGRRLSETIVPLRHRAGHEAGMAHYHATGQGPVLGKRVELEGLHRDGHEFPVEVAISAVATEDGELFSAFMRDLTERHRYEGSLHLARVEAEQASEAKSRFLATMSHEIRSPLSALVSMSALLLETRLDDEQREFARVANEGGQSLMALINDILDFSQIESGRLVLDPRPLDVVELVSRVVELFSAQAQARGIELFGVYAPGVPREVLGDELRIRQVVTNLVSNAVKFTSEGGVIVRVVWHNEEDLVIDVHDSGIGIPEERQARIFEEFVQAEDSDARRFGGSGLGLTIVQRLARLMGGRISLRSEQGKGSRFRVRLPLEPVAEPGAVAPTAVEVVASSPAVWMRVSNRVLAHAVRDQLRLLGASLPADEELGALPPGTPVLCLAGDDENATAFERVRDQARALAPQVEWRIVALLPSTIVGLERTRAWALYDDVIRMPARVGTLRSVLEREQVDQKAARAVATRAAEAGSTLAPMSGVNPMAEATATEAPPEGPAVLLVEDSAANRAVALAILNREGYRVVIAENGREALERAAEERFAVILMDLAMPEMDGLEATRRLRAGSGPNATSPIVAMTANAFAEDRERCLAAGMDDFLSKPVDIPTFRASVREWAEDATEHTGAFSLLTASDASGVLDERVLRKMAEETSWDIVPELLVIFVNETQARIPRMSELLASEGLEQLGEEAHSLKGASGSFGAIRLQAIAREIEQAARSDDMATARSAAAPLLTVAGQTYVAIERFLKQTADAQTAD